MPVMKKQPNKGIGEHAMGAARFGIHAGQKAYGLGKGALETGQKGYEFGKKLMALRAEEREMEEKRTRTLSERGLEESLKAPTVEEELEAMRQRRVEKLLKRFPAETAQELGQLIEQAMEQNIGGRQMHKLLGDFFSKKYPLSLSDKTEKANMARWIRVILRVTNPEYASGLKGLEE